MADAGAYLLGVMPPELLKVTIKPASIVLHVTSSCYVTLQMLQYPPLKHLSCRFMLLFVSREGCNCLHDLIL